MCVFEAFSLRHFIEYSASLNTLACRCSCKQFLVRVQRVHTRFWKQSDTRRRGTRPAVTLSNEAASDADTASTRETRLLCRYHHERLGGPGSTYLLLKAGISSGSFGRLCGSQCCRERSPPWCSQTRERTHAARREREEEDAEGRRARAPRASERGLRELEFGALFLVS
jgi:hypothetical protein